MKKARPRVQKKLGDTRSNTIAEYRRDRLRNVILMRTLPNFYIFVGNWNKIHVTRKSTGNVQNEVLVIIISG